VYEIGTLAVAGEWVEGLAGCWCWLIGGLWVAPAEWCWDLLAYFGPEVARKEEGSF